MNRTTEHGYRKQKEGSVLPEKTGPDKGHTTVYLLRHCEPEPSEGDDLGRPLTQKGRADAVKAARFLQGRNISGIWSSDALRAIQTVTPFAEMTGLEVCRDARLREGILGCRPEENPVYSRRQWEDHEFCLPAGESLNQVKKRMRAVMRDILAGSADKKVLICTHCTAMCALINSYDREFGWETAGTKKRVWPWIVRMEFNGEGAFLGFREIFPETGEHTVFRERNT